MYGSLAECVNLHAKGLDPQQLQLKKIFLLKILSTISIQKREARGNSPAWDQTWQVLGFTSFWANLTHLKSRFTNTIAKKNSGLIIFRITRTIPLSQDRSHFKWPEKEAKKCSFVRMESDISRVPSFYNTRLLALMGFLKRCTWFGGGFLVHISLMVLYSMNF